MSQSITKSSLSPARRRLIEILQALNFGRVEGLQVSNAEPVFDPPPRIVQKFKMGGENGTRPEVDLPDFLLRRPTIELLQVITHLKDGEVAAIEVKHGLPFAVDVERSPEQLEGSRGEL